MAAAERPNKTYVWKNPHVAALIASIFVWLQLLLLLAALGLPWLPPGTLYKLTGIMIPRDVLYLTLTWFGVVASASGVAANGYWTFRVTSNARWHKPNCRYGPWGAVLWYLIPGANLVLPYLSLRAVWRASAPSQTPTRAEWLLLVFWISLWLSYGLNYLARYLQTHRELSEDPLAIPTFHFWRDYAPALGANGVAVLSAAAFLLVLRQISKAQVTSHPLHLAKIFSDAPPLVP